ncbi:MAG: DNA repair exonuclease [Thermoplasmata archaeon]|nr:DNA repair exonuclease [Thermoplasmata archaeon]
MGSFKFIHAADLHLDSPFKGISEIDPAIQQELAEATFKSFDKIIELCIEEKVDFLLIAGDVYDSQDKSLRAQLRFIDGLERLSDRGIHTYLVHGNHDPSSGWASSLKIPDLVHVFTGKKVHKDIFQRDGENLAKIYGYSYSRRDIMESVIPEFEEKVIESPQYTIGLLHCCLGTATGHEPYAPCLIGDLTKLPINYWALGHVHNKQVINENPAIVYPGNIQGRHIRENGEKGVFLIEVDDSHNTTIHFQSTENIIWDTREISIDKCKTFQELRKEINTFITELRSKSDGKPAICRIYLTGRGSLNKDLMKQSNVDDLVTDIRECEKTESPFVWIEDIKIQTSSPIDREKLKESEDFIGQLVRMYDTLYENDAERQEIIDAVQLLFESPRGKKHLPMPTGEELLELIKKAEYLTYDKLLGEKK